MLEGFPACNLRLVSQAAGGPAALIPQVRVSDCRGLASMLDMNGDGNPLDDVPANSRKVAR